MRNNNTYCSIPKGKDKKVDKVIHNKESPEIQSQNSFVNTPPPADTQIKINKKEK